MLLRKFSGGLPDRLKFSSAICRGYCAVAASNTGLSNGSDGLQLTLLGPPELYQSPFTTAKKEDNVTSGVFASPTTADSSTGDPFMDLMLSSYNRYEEPVMGRTENYYPTYMSSGNPCLDFFFHVVPDTPAEQVVQRLKQAWEQDPCTALKLVCNLRGIRGTGKSDREGFYTSALWLQENHPKTLAGNAGSVAGFGYFKDLLEILYRLLEGPTVRKDEIDLLKKRRRHGGSQWWLKHGGAYLEEEGKKGLKPKPKSTEEKRLTAAKKGIERYNNDPTYRFLHNHVSELFAKHLQSDLEKIRSGTYDDLSLAAKWCPSLYSRFDNYTLLCESIARRLFPQDQYPEYEGIEDAHYAYRVRDCLRKEVLVPLRKSLKLPEVYMCAREWNYIVYSRVASIAMKNYAQLFYKNDAERLTKYLERVVQGKSKIAAGALLPHQIVKKVKDPKNKKDPMTRIVSELQWKRMVEDLSNIGKLKNCLAICDVSGSMYGLPLEVSVALGLLVSELSEEPWKGKLITFSRFPQLQVIQVTWNLMEASANDWETDYQAIVRKFNEKGFSKVPEIVFWNLRNSGATPVLSNQKGVALVSGFSKNLLKMFLDDSFLEPEKPIEAEVPESEKIMAVETTEAEVLDPVKTMEAAISGEEYEKLVVLD
uniref:Uncharacterized protein n=1 Tax=Chenopodium quinoa TaxID=63459 RepID=A0A803M6R6_CHEQI